MSNLFTYDEDPNFNGEKILIIDEDFLLADLIHFHFSKKGFGIDVCKSLDITHDLDMTEYSMIIIDLNYDFEKSLVLISDVRNDSLTEETPIVICSKMNNNKAIVAALNAGADDYITRPFAINELLIRLHKLLGIKLMPDTSASQAS
ncbi:MAG: response regulator transcription factor [Bacteroidales bacterium]|nr:response regulator transcription factor [Bacteroidales bacterium]